MSRWFRFYAEALRNPKVRRLSDKDFRLWVELLAIASENEGAIPPADDLKHMLKMRLDYLSTALERLLKGSLIDALADGYEPHNWSKYQYKSDVSTERVHKHRAKRNVSETPPDTDTDTEKKEAETNVSAARAVFPKPDFADEQVWKDFLANRRKKRLTNTATAYRQLLADIARIADDEWPPGRLLEYAAGKGWGSVNDPREGQPNDRQRQPNGLRGSRPDPSLDLLRGALADQAAERGAAADRGAWPSLPAIGTG